MFTSYLMRSGGLLALLLVSLIGVIRVRPYDDGGLGALLGDACETPCWQGIYPGSSTGPEALHAVQQIDRVRGLGSNFSFYVGQVFWRWSQDSAHFLDPDTREFAYVWIERNVVKTIFLPGFHSFADIALLIGRPQKVTIYTDSFYSPRYAVYLASYPNKLYLSSLIHCDSSAHDLWASPTNIYIGQQPEYMGASGREYPRAELEGWMPANLCRRR